YDKQYKESLRIIIYFLIFAIIPFFFFTQEHGFIENVAQWLSAALYRGSDAAFPFAVQRKVFENDSNIQYIIKLLIVYPFSIIGIIAGYFQHVQWKKIGFLICSGMLIFAGTHATLTYFFVIVAMFLNENHKIIDFGDGFNFDMKKNMVYLLAFVLLLQAYQFPSLSYGIRTQMWVSRGAFWIIFFMLFADALYSFYNKCIKQRKESAIL
ncbi:MAG: hypothetical protein LBN20_01620, partial [Endomicrobium sp.]|nr:hypothetical protein [Endomicrobium sp.]